MPDAGGLRFTTGVLAASGTAMLEPPRRQHASHEQPLDGGRRVPKTLGEVIIASGSQRPAAATAGVTQRLIIPALLDLVVNPREAEPEA